MRESAVKMYNNKGNKVRKSFGRQIDFRPGRGGVVFQNAAHSDWNLNVCINAYISMPTFTITKHCTHTFLMICCSQIPVTRINHMSGKKAPTWTPDDLQNTLRAVSEEGMSRRKAAETFGIPWGTFSDKLSGQRSSEVKMTTVLTEEEDGKLVQFIIHVASANRGFGRTRDDLLTTVKNMLDHTGRKTSWPNNMGHARRKMVPAIQEAPS